MNLQFRPFLSKAAATPEALQLASMASESSRFFVATVASQRAKQLARGALPRIQIGHSLNTVALAEVRAGLIEFSWGAPRYIAVAEGGQPREHETAASEPPIRTALRPANSLDVTVSPELHRALTREDFGPWARELKEADFWKAVAMLGVLDPRALDRLSDASPDAAVEIATPDLRASGNVEIDNWAELSWHVDAPALDLARSGRLSDAGWFVEAWEQLIQELPGALPIRVGCRVLYANHHFLAEVFHAHANAIFYCALPEVAPAEWWSSPARVAIPSLDQYASIRREVQARLGASGSKLVREATGRDRSAEFLLLRGEPDLALKHVEQLPVPVRAYCVVLLCQGRVALDSKQYQALMRLRSRTFAQGIVYLQVPDRSPLGWIEEFAKHLPRTRSVLEALLRAAPSVPAMLLEPRTLRAASYQAWTQASIGSYFVHELRSEGFHGKPYIGAGSKYPDVEDKRRLKVTVSSNGQPVEAFVPLALHTIDVRIAPAKARPDRGTLQAIFEASNLPVSASGHLLTVTLVAPALLERPIVETILLPASGESTPCSFVLPAGESGTPIEARITIAYRNRILQTYLILGKAGGEPFQLVPEMATQADWHGLDAQSAYGASIVVNRISDQPLAVAQYGYRAYPFSLVGLNDAIDEIEGEIGKSKWDAATFQGLRAAGTAKLVHKLAKHGFTLLKAMKAYAPPDDEGRAFLEGLLAADPIQVMAANLGARLPIEFFYANPYPTDKALLCPTYDADPERKSCDGCPQAGDAHYCPLGFWSLRKVIEWHDFDEAKRRLNEFAPRDFAIEGNVAIDRRDRLRPAPKVLVGLSEKVSAVDSQAAAKLLAAIQAAGTAPIVASDWKDWPAKIASEKPALLVILAHTLKNDDGEECLEIGGTQLASAQIEAPYITTQGAPGPIVLLIGCNTDNFGVPFRSFAANFMIGGAAVVVSSISHLLGRHAAPLAADLVRAVASAQSAGNGTFGQLMRDLRRTLLRGSGPPISLVLKSYGDARWRF